MCLLLGIIVYPGVEFDKLLEPHDTMGWHATFHPTDHAANQFDFEVIVGTDGRRSSLPGFEKRELRGKLALAITANFTNYGTREEAACSEISGVAFIFNQQFFKDLKQDTGIDLENIVYYRDDTHYVVMTAKKDSLISKGVLMTVSQCLLYTFFLFLNLHLSISFATFLCFYGSNDLTNLLPHAIC